MCCQIAIICWTAINMKVYNGDEGRANRVHCSVAIVRAKISLLLSRTWTSEREVGRWERTRPCTPGQLKSPHDTRSKKKKFYKKINIFIQRENTPQPPHSSLRIHLPSAGQSLTTLLLNTEKYSPQNSCSQRWKHRGKYVFILMIMVMDDP